VRPKLRVWILFGKQLKFGDGRARLLELIDARGSLRQAAAELDMSYRNAWGYLQDLEKAAGFKLVARAPDGTLRSGMRLTPNGREFLACYREFQRSLDRAAARHFDRTFRGRTFGRRGGSRPSRA
jgi:molybdate transport system regulatory protein